MATTLLTAMLGVLAAALLRGFTGFGFGLAAVPLLSLALPPAKVVPLVVVLQVMVGGAGLRRAWHDCDWRAVRHLTPGLLLGVPIGLVVLTEFAPDTVRLVIGLVILGSVLLLWRGLALHASRLTALGVGLVAGVLSGLASMGGPPIVVYLLALRHGATAVRATSIVYFMLSATVSLLVMLARGLIDQEILLWAAGSIPVLVAGTFVGNWGFARSKPHHLRLVALLTLTVLSLTLIARGLHGWLGD